MFVLTPVLFTVLTTAASALPRPAQPPTPPPEMQRLADRLVGNYTLTETHHARPGSPEWSISGTASYRSGPDGMSVIEEYQSDNPKGPFTAIAVLWWDDSRGVFKHFECETGEPCGVVDDTGRWDGDSVIFAREIAPKRTSVAPKCSSAPFRPSSSFSSADEKIPCSTRYSPSRSP